jgi:hypothetical protein
MKKNVLSIEINAPVETVFEFTRNPNDNRGFAPMTPRVFSAGPSGLAVSFL